MKQLYWFDAINNTIIMKLNNSIDWVVNQKGSSFVIRYDRQSLQSIKKNNAKPQKNQDKITNKYMACESQLFLQSPKKIKRQLNFQTEISHSSHLQRIIKPIKRIQSIQQLLENQKDKEKDDLSRIPIQYYDERDHGCPADRLRARVVYRGYAPKNTYFYLKTIRQIKYQSKSSAIRQDHLSFNSKFQSGNLIAASRISTTQYWLFMRQDTNTNGLRQWFYFEVKNRKPIVVKFRIYKFTKHYSLYKDGMKPYVKIGMHGQWKQEGQKIKYQYDHNQKCFYLQFEYNFEQQNRQTYFATLPPYSYSNLIDYVESLKGMPYVKVRSLGKSLGGLDIPIIQIHKKSIKEKATYGGMATMGKITKVETIATGFDKLEDKKEAIFIMARTHPGETCSNFSLQSLISKLLEAPKSYKWQLIDDYDFYIIPMVNPDGVYLGNHRTNALGVDMNRFFKDPDPEIFPQIYFVENQVANIKKHQKIAFLIDLHGHSAKKNIFAYGEENQIGTKKHLLSRILPKILSQTISTFKYDHCVFKGVKEKKNTARVYFSHRYQINSITFEQSYGLINEGSIGILHWRNFGVALHDALGYLTQITKNGTNLQQYLKNEIQEEKKKIERTIEKQKKMLEIMKIIKQNQKTKNISETRINSSRTISISTDRNERESQIQGQLIQKKQKAEELNGPHSQTNESELESGDEDLELDENLEHLKKQIVRVGCLKEGFKRQIFLMADKKLQLSNWERNSQPILHQQISSIGERMLRLQNKRKQGGLTSLIKDRNSIELPSLRR